jgi:hypothetical protein
MFASIELKTILLSIAAVIFLIGFPVVMIWSFVDFFRRKGSERRGGGGVSSFVGAGLEEIDRLLARPSVEHKIEAENQVQKREDDKGGE